MKKLIASALIILSLSACETQPHRQPIPPAHKVNFIDLYSKAHKVPALLVRAVIKHESGGNVKAKREETKNAWLNKVCKSDRSCKTSFGLGQVLGLHAKALKLRSAHDLLDPETNIYATTKILGRCFHAAKRDTSKTLTCYNGDKTGKYARKVTSSLKEILHARR